MDEREGLPSPSIDLDPLLDHARHGIEFGELLRLTTLSARSLSLPAGARLVGSHTIQPR
jgi:hypothetical protein